VRPSLAAPSRDFLREEKLSVEVAGADLALVLDRGEALFGGRELGFLQLTKALICCARSRRRG
jgi:hypothetical protein